MRDHNGRWIGGFRKSLGCGNSILVELWAIFHGIDLALHLGCVALIIESDCNYVIDLISNASDSTTHHYSPLIIQCRSKLGRIQQYKLQHTVKEGNFCADTLAKSVVQDSCDLVLFDRVPAFVLPMYLADCFGIVYPRKFDVG